jgi:hypothetical protein
VPIYSDATDPIQHDDTMLKNTEKKVREYVADIKSGAVGKEIFGNDTSYTKAVGYLMELTGLKGCPLVATSKFSCVSSEYNVGQMGGSAGGGRGVQFGYQKNGKPVNRALGNGFAISIPLSDYKSLRDSNDLIDATMDAPGELTLVNRKIEEVTFVSKIDGKFVKGSLPMVLPRLDRDWDEDMTREKHDQYRRVFKLEKADYKKFQKLLEEEGEYPLGQLTEHLIRHHGKLMREIVINADRKEGYEGEFVAIRNSSQVKGRQKCGDLDDINNGELNMSARDARTDSSSKKSPYLESEAKEEPQDLSERLGDHVQGTPIKKKTAMSTTKTSNIKPKKNEDISSSNPAKKLTFSSNQEDKDDDSPSRSPSPKMDYSSKGQLKKGGRG